MTTGTTDLASALIDLGVEIKRVGETEISGCCPVHISRTGHADRSPSWSMNAETGLWICYSCGARGTLSSLLSEITGDDKSIVDVHMFLIESGIKRMTAQPREEEEPAVDWLAYSRFSEVPELHLYNRNIHADVARRYGIRWDTRNKAWIIPIVALSGQLMGWQIKKVNWIRNYPIGVKKSHTLFGVERFTSDTALLVESPLDVVRLASVKGLDLQGLATFGAYVSNEQVKTLSSVASRVIVAMDNDEAGLKSSMALHKFLPRFKDGVLWLNYKNTKAKDIGDMKDDEIREAINGATAVPGWVL